MKYGIFRNILLFSFIIALPSCYQDLGNYEYKEINEIVITPGKYSFMPPAPGMTATVTIDPDVSQTMTEGTANLSYEWRRQVTAVSWETVCNDPVYNMEVTSADVSAINLIFAVTDTDLGITTYAEIQVIPEFAFSQTWFLLQNVNGQAVLGTVDGEGDARGVNPDISTQISGLSLTGSPKGLGINPFRRSNSIFSGMASYEILLGVFTSDKPYILNGSTLAEHSLNYFRLLYGKTVSGDMTFSPELMDGQRNGFAIIDDGRLWYSVPDEYSLMYAVNISDELGGGDTYRAEDLCHYTRSQHLLLYDGLGNRFLRYSNANDLGMGYSDRQSIVEGGSAEYETYLTGTRNNRDVIESIGEGNRSNVFDPENIPSGFVIDDMSRSTGDLMTNIVATGHTGNTLHIYEFCMYAMVEAAEGSATLPYCSNSWTVSAAGDLSVYPGRVPVTTSYYFTRTIFYAAGNNIYKVDLTVDSPSPEPVWTAEDPSAVITGLKFKSDYEDIAYNGGSASGSYEYKGITHQLGAVVRHADGSCDLAELALTAAGEIERNDAGEPEVLIFEGFTEVVDFVFSFRDIIN